MDYIYMYIYILYIVCTLYIYIYFYLYSVHVSLYNIYTGLFISPSGISELDCATTKTDTAERSISAERETLQVSVLPYRCFICAPLVTRKSVQHLAVDSSDLLHDPLSQLW